MCAAAAQQQTQPGSWGQEASDLVRALSGAFLFGTPLLFTMEMWWIGTHLEPSRLLVLLALVAAANLGLTYFAGFKEEQSLAADFAQTIEVLGVGALASIIVLAVIGELRLSTPPDIAAAKVLLQVVPLSIGAAVANAVFARGRTRVGDDEGSGEKHSVLWRNANDFGAAAAGALFLSFSIAPTEEVPMLASGMGAGHTIALIALSFLVSYGIVFASGFSEPEQIEGAGAFQHPITETAVAYVVALAVAAATLLLLGQMQLGDPLGESVAMIVVLGFPAAVGGAAGRLVV